METIVNCWGCFQAGFLTAVPEVVYMSLQIVGHHLFVLLVGLGVVANSGPQARGELRKRFRDFLTLRNVR